MGTLHIEHAISDFGTWIEAFGRFADVRRDAGARNERIHQPIDDPNYVVVDVDFETADQASAFLRFLQDQVWPNSPALVGAPRTMILRPRPLTARTD